jgi:hypothetical protein
MAGSKRVRYEVLRRDNHACRYCGAAAPDVPLTFDHVVPVALGGSDEPSNLVTACRDCNSGKTSTSPDGPLVAEVDAKAAQWAQAMAIVAQGRAVERYEHQQISDHLYDHWQGNRPNQWRSSDLPADWENSVWQFMDAGLELEDLEELMLVALTTRTATDKWRYFCGCCWTRVRQSQEHAARIVSRWEDTEEEDYEVSSEEVYWAAVALKWKEKTGTRLRICLCADEPCNRNDCTLAVAHFAQGALYGIAGVTDQFTKQESDETSQAEEATDGA